MVINLDDGLDKPDAVVSGPAYGAVLRRGDRIVSSHPHIHFTEHSARACAVGQLQRSDAKARERISAINLLATAEGRDEAIE